MKRLMLFLFIAILLTACSVAPAETEVVTGVIAGTPTPQLVQGTPEVLETAYLNTDFENAASIRNQLGLGTLHLAGTENAVTQEQAAALLPLWQAVIALGADQTAVTEEMTAVQDQIIAGMTQEQIAAISAMQITNTDLDAYYAEKGIVMPTPQPGVTRVPGSGKDVPPEVRAATRAAAEASGIEGGGGGKGQLTKSVLFEDVVASLTTIAGQ